MSNNPYRPYYNHNQIFSEPLIDLCGFLVNGSCDRHYGTESDGLSTSAAEDGNDQ